MALPFILVGLFIAGIIVYAIIGTIHERRIHSRLDRFGLTLNGRITDRSERKYDKGFTYHVKYLYEYGGVEYEYEQQINKPAFDSCKLSMPVKVRCLPDRPEIARLIFPTGHLHLGWENLDWE